MVRQFFYIRHNNANFDVYHSNINITFYIVNNTSNIIDYEFQNKIYCIY